MIQAEQLHARILEELDLSRDFLCKVSVTEN